MQFIHGTQVLQSGFDMLTTVDETDQSTGIDRVWKRETDHFFRQTR